MASSDEISALPWPFIEFDVWDVVRTEFEKQVACNARLAAESVWSGQTRSTTGFQRGRPAVALRSYTYLSLAEDEWPRSIRETEGEQDSERNGRRGLLPDGAYNVANLCLLVCASVSEKSS